MLTEVQRLPDPITRMSVNPNMAVTVMSFNKRIFILGLLVTYNVASVPYGLWRIRKKCIAAASLLILRNEHTFPQTITISCSLYRPTLLCPCVASVLSAVFCG